MTTSTPRILNPENWLWILKHGPEALYDMIHSLSPAELRELHQQRNKMGEHFVYELVQARISNFDDSLTLLKKLELPDLNIYAMRTSDGYILSYAFFYGPGYKAVDQHKKTGSIELLKHIVSHYPTPDHHSFQTGDTSIHYAARTGHNPGLQALFELGANMELKNKDNQNIDYLAETSITMQTYPELYQEYLATRTSQQLSGESLATKRKFSL